MASNNKHISTRVGDNTQNKIIAENIKISLLEEFKQLSGYVVGALETVAYGSQEVVSHLRSGRLKTLQQDELDKALLFTDAFVRKCESELNTLEKQLRALSAAVLEFGSRKKTVEYTIDKFCKTKKEKSLEIGGVWPAIEEK